VDLLLEHGLPGSGHTQPDHPIFEWIKPHLRADQIEPLHKLLDRARADAKVESPSTISELQPADQQAKPDAASDSGSADAGASSRTGLIVIIALVALSAGYLRGRGRLV
jgi:cobaltochelatase CobN